MIAELICLAEHVPGQRCGAPIERRDELTCICTKCQTEYRVQGDVPHLLWGDLQPFSDHREDGEFSTYHEHHFGAFVPAEQADSPADAPSIWHEVGTAHAPSEIFYSTVLDAIRPYLSDVRLAIDVGCKLGRMAAEISAAGAEQTIGVDLGAAALVEARRILFDPEGSPSLTFALRARRTRPVVAELPWRLSPEKLGFVCADARRLPLRDGAADLALLLNVVDATPRPEEVVQEAWRCVAPGGRLVITDPFDYLDTSKRSGHIYELADFLGDADDVMPDPYETVVPFPLRVEWSQVVAVYRSNLAIFEKRR
ncbi:MAG TPA: class I SAM-dependent methyltransferase [Solirubrobacterales bacterium]|nr:class I SAM-dependent methyltransferase [Solirubrobacterales bacterium]